MWYALFYAYVPCYGYVDDCFANILWCLSCNLYSRGSKFDQHRSLDERRLGCSGNGQ